MKGFIVEMINAEGKLRFISKMGKDVFSIIEDCEIDFADFIILNITEFDPKSECGW
ncbi:MAG: hypothetical protein Q4E53_11585 [Eubacteriales bacterium]|nr:hypothetical protein [Eubacteriales bacterium]